MELLKVKNLSFTYPESSEPTIKDISFNVDAGDYLCICGPTGCGKSTLLKLIKRELAPLGNRSGSIFLGEMAIEELDKVDSATQIGIVMQRPEQQIVCDKVWHELAFGLENLGISTGEIRRRVAEMAAYFGIEEWFDMSTADLSGGQKQLLNLASVMVMQPSLLILDEPTAQLDPIAASNFLNTVRKINSELGITVMIVEHRLEEVLSSTNKMLLMKDGRIEDYGPTKKVIAGIGLSHYMFDALPGAARVYKSLCKQAEQGLEIPLEVKEGRLFLLERDKHKKNLSCNCCYIQPDFSEDKRLFGKQKIKVLEGRELFFRYSRNSTDILNGVNLELYEDEVLCLLGGNGSGKTTLIKALAGIIKPYAGLVLANGKKMNKPIDEISVLPQDVQTMFLYNTVREEVGELSLISKEYKDINDIYCIEALMDKHPYDLSGGEQQIVGLLKVMQNKPNIILMDEPTKGFDAHMVKIFVDIITALKNNSITVLIVTHDVELAARVSDRCAMMFNGEITATGIPRAFFDNNFFYTTVANKLSKGIQKGVLFSEEIT